MRLLATLAALFCILSPSVQAEKLTFPNTGEAMFQITIPDSWSPDIDEDDVVEATSPEENISLSIWKIDSSTTMETVTNDLKDILKEYADDVELVGEPETIEVDGLPGLFLVGTGNAHDDNDLVGFIAFILVKDEDAAIVYFELDDDATEVEQEKFKAILSSIDVL